MRTDIKYITWAVSGNVKTGDSPVINMSDRVRQATDELRGFMFEHVYNVQSENADARHARRVVKGLYGYLIEQEDKLPPEYLSYSDETERRVVDYIAGMTDQYALNLAHDLGI
jgi:dGTPase